MNTKKTQIKAQITRMSAEISEMLDGVPFMQIEGDKEACRLIEKRDVLQKWVDEREAEEDRQWWANKTREKF